MIQEMNTNEIIESGIVRDIFETEEKGILYTGGAMKKGFEYQESILPEITGGYRQ